MVPEVPLRTQYSVFRGFHQLDSVLHVSMLFRFQAFILPLPTGLCSKSFSVQLSRYSSGPGFLPFGSLPVSPENDTELFRNLSDSSSDHEALASFLWNLLFGISTRQFLASLSYGVSASGFLSSAFCFPSVRSTFGSASAFLLPLSP